jgi:GH18 family chitinase
MLAFTSTTVPLISQSLDFWNIMTYDLMNRRDDVTKHHTGIQASLESVNAYLERGVEAEKMNLGFAFYVKWFRTAENGGCERNPVGCKTVLMENPETGADLGQAGAFSWDDDVPKELEDSFGKALEGGMWDSVGGGWYFWDEAERIWWSWDTPEVIAEKFPMIVEQKGLGGVFAWGLGEDAPGWERLEALTEGYKRWKGGLDERVKDEL